MTYEIEKTTSWIISDLYRGGNPNKAVLSSLRNAATMESQRAQAVWPIMMARLDARYLSRNGTPTSAETAVYAALRFYAIHQQGKEQSVYGSAGGEDPEGQQLFEALGKMRRNEETRVALDRRVQPLLATTNAASVINGLSHLVSILKANNGTQKIDYAHLAQDLYGLQGSYERANRVRLIWGQQYFRENQAGSKTKGEKN
mgnify:FL=1